ncbi:hypothetical protein GCM10009106_11760 [Sphingomonas japonica]|nr:polysaccharide biosynthesis tyrosine autokinase [Sphingomonas japonica]
MDFRRIWVLLRRNALIIAGIVTVAAIIGLIATLLMQPTYIAEASVQIEQETDRVLESQSVEPVAAYQDADRFLQTQTDILRSRAMSRRVAQALNLLDANSFFEAMGTEPPEEIPGMTLQQAKRDAVVDLLLENLLISLPQDSRLVTIGFRSPNPRLAARIANTYATEFIRSNLERKFESSSYARDFLSKQLAETKARLEQSEREVNAYARQAGLIRTEDDVEGGSGQQSVTSASLVQLNAAANDAIAARIAAEQKWRSVERTPALSIPDVLANQAIQGLLQQRSERTAALQQELERHRESHPTVLQLRAQIGEVNSQIDTLAAGIRSSIYNQYQSALLRERSLIAEVGQSKGARLAEQDRGVRFNILAREADTNRTLYDGLLQRFKEVSAAAGISSNNISIVDEAEQPTEPDSPKLPLNLALSILIGLAAALGIVFIREQLDDAIRAPEDVETKLSATTLGIIPAVDERPIDQLSDPRSPVSEAYNALRTALLYSTSEGLPASMFVTSSQASEGKSTTSLAIAVGLAKLGKKVVLIDTDLRRPAMHILLGLPNGLGLSDLLTSTQSLSAALRPTSHENLSFVSSGPVPPSPTELLGGMRFPEIVAELEADFDAVVIDGPPVLGLADAPIVAGIAAGTVFVVEANRGHRGGTKSAMRRLRSARASILGVVLTKFDNRKAGSDYGNYGNDYYSYGHHQD